mgnify:FL=1
MSGHSKWSQIKRQKGVTDKKRGQLFAKLGSAITVAAKSEPNPQFNPRLRSAVEKAREFQMPNDNIERAIKKASDKNLNVEELTFESYGPGGSALFIEAITDSRNRTVAEVKKILHDHEGKWAESGSVRWAFDQAVGEGGERSWKAKFPQILSEKDHRKLEKLIEALDEHDDVQDIFTNTPETE